MPLTVLMYSDCTSYNGQIRENVGLERSHCSWVCAGFVCCGPHVNMCVFLPPSPQFEKVRELMQGTHSRGATNPPPGMHTGMVSGHRGLILPSESHFHGEQALITVRDSGPNTEVYTMRTYIDMYVHTSVACAWFFDFLFDFFRLFT